MDDQISSGMNRLQALLGWWGLSGYENRSSIPEQFIRLQNFIAEVQKASLNATGRHMNAIFASNDRLVRSAYDLLNGGKQSELSAVHAQIVSIILETAAQHVRNWAEFQHQVQEIYAASTRPSTNTAPGASGSTTTQVKDKRSSQPAAEKLVDAA